MALRKAEQLIAELRAENEQMDHEVGAYHGNKRDLQRYFGAETVFGAFLVLDSIEGRALTADAILKAVEAIAPTAIEQARIKVCGPAG